MKSRIRFSFLFLSLGLFIVGCGSDAPEPEPTATTAIELAATEAESGPTAVPTNVPEATETEPEVSEPGEPIRIGVFADSIPPLTILEGGTYSGFEVELATEIINRLYGNDTVIEWVPIAAPERFSSLAEGQVDMLVRGVLHTTSREELALFSGAYLLSGNSFLVYQDEGYGSIADLDGETIATIVFMADGLNEVAGALGLTFDVIGYSDIDEALGGIGLNNGFRRAAALYLDWVQLASFMDPDVHALLTDISSFGPMAVAFPLGEEDLRDEVNNVLNEMIGDGTWQSLFDKWFGIAVPWNVEEMLDIPRVDQ